MPNKSSIIADGHRRAYWANIRSVRAQVQREFSPRLANAGFWKRLIVWLQFQSEIRRRMNRIAPPWALYSRSPRSKP
jgi:hypothetical protein